MILSKQEYIDMLNKDPRYQVILNSAKSDREREAIKSTVEKFLGSFADAFIPAAHDVKNNPEKFIEKNDKEIDPSLIIVDTNRKDVEKK